MHRKSHISSKRNSSNEDLNAKELDTFGDDKDESRAEKVPIPVMESMRDKTSSSDAEEPQESDEEDSNASAVMFKLNKKAQKFCGDKAIIIDISDDDENDHGEQNGIEELCDID
ncbi:unnamed protein product [Allacma fusca]|uniref:Uncharacterized protein n=1 Tax=Allacma fusca TaxID=39272 RepID=A0A8J2P9V1_9HEXA|nr:unnamed protein product [Allacma fusca]